LIVIGDVIGTGVAGSMVSAAAKSCCDALAARGELVEPGTLLTLLNRALYRPVKPIQMTCFAALFDVQTSVLSWANAGHPVPYMAAAAEERLTVLPGGGPMLGDEADARWVTQRRSLVAGDSVLLYTDGIVEAMNSTRSPFGERRLQRAFQAARAYAPGQTRDLVLRALEEFRGGAAPVDDEVLVIVKRG
jgi:serine phosphatase RsbU (regulator of sigma subunit)